MADANVGPDTFDSLRDMADRGDPRAMLLLGSRLLVGNQAPFDPVAGLSWVNKAAQAANPDAYNLLATLSAAGAWVPQNWQHAVDLLATAAEMGSEDARRQILLLTARSRKLTQDQIDQFRLRGDWRSMCGAVDLEAFVRPPQRAQICDSPRIWTAEKFASSDECDWLIDRARDKMSPAQMYDRRTQTKNFVGIRNNSDYFFDIVESHLLLVLLRIRISLLVDLPVPHFEPPQMLHYGPGQELRAHFDNLRDGSKGYGKQDSYKGDRVVTFLCYLNDGYDGGETEFMRANLKFKGKKGDGIFFANMRNGELDKMSLHSGTPIIAGEKWLLSQWIHDRPFVAEED